MRQLQELAASVNGKIIGQADILISGINDLSLASAGEICFLGNPKYLQVALKTKASAILVESEHHNQPFPCTAIVVENASQAFTKLVELFTPPPIQWKPEIHPSAFVDPSAQIDGSVYIGPKAIIEPEVVIGPNTHIGAGSYIGHQCTLGEHCFIHPNVTLRERCKLDHHVIIHSGSVIGSDGFGYEFTNGQYVKIPQTGYVKLDAYVEIGANVCIDRGRFAHTWIKEGSKIDNLVQIAHNVTVGPHAVIVAQSGISGSTSAGAYLTMGGQSATVGHLKLGDQVTLTARSAATKNLQKGIYRGAPAQPLQTQLQYEALIHRLPDLSKRLRKLELKVLEKLSENP